MSNADRTDNSNDDKSGSSRRDVFELVHGFVTASLEGELTNAEIADFEQLLRDHSQARRLYAEYLETTIELSRIAADRAAAAPNAGRRAPVEPAPDVPATAADSKNSKLPSKSPVLGFLGGAMDYVNHSRTMMFSLIALALSGWFVVQLGSLMLSRSRPGGAQVASQPGDSNSPEVSHPPGGSFAHSAHPRQGDPVASLTADVDCHWRVVAPAAPTASAPAPGDADTSEPFHVGSELFAGQQLDLARGLAEITFRSGARIVLNGPAHFVVGSNLGGALQVGKLTARVPHDARGFSVDSPAGKVVDLGTEFGVAVAADHSMIVEVFVGEVSVSSSAVGQTLGSSDRVAAGHAAKVVAGQPVVSIPPKPNRFVVGLGPRENPRKAQAVYLEWMRHLKPVVWYRMEGQGDDRVLHDEMRGPDAKLYWDGPGNPFVEGRLGKGLWLRGAPLNDCAVASSYPQADHDKLSVSAWVYAESRPANAVILSNWGDQGGQFQLGLGMDGGPDVSVGICETDGKNADVREGVSQPFPLYKWQHVAFTTDGSTLRLYRQGREVANARHSGLRYPSPCSALGIGNRQTGTGNSPNQVGLCWWDGRLDEIAVFNDVLSADDIQILAAAPPN